jgi:hypothetical protein
LETGIAGDAKKSVKKDAPIYPLGLEHGKYNEQYHAKGIFMFHLLDRYWPNIFFLFQFTNNEIQFFWSKNLCQLRSKEDVV